MDLSSLTNPVLSNIVFGDTLFFPKRVGGVFGDTLFSSRQNAFSSMSCDANTKTSQASKVKLHGSRTCSSVCCMDRSISSSFFTISPSLSLAALDFNMSTIIPPERRVFSNDGQPSSSPDDQLSTWEIVSGSWWNFSPNLEKRVERENDVESVSELELGAMEGTLTIEM